MDEKPIRQRWQFSLRGIMAAMLLLAIGFGLYARYRPMPALKKRIYHKNGVVAGETYTRTNWFGTVSWIHDTIYYSNGQTAWEGPRKGGAMSYWRPDGTPAVDLEDAVSTWHRDNGDGTFQPGPMPTKAPE